MIIAAGGCCAATPAVDHLRCEYLDNPLGIDAPAPPTPFLFLDSSSIDFTRRFYRVQLGPGTS